MKVLVLQHVPYEGIGSMEDWLSRKNAEIRYFRFYEARDLPNRPEADLVIVMGGPMSVHDEGCYSWLTLEKQFLREVLDAGIPLLGVCLGAQLIAAALGSSVYRNEFNEIGWFPIEGLSVSKPVFRFPTRLKVFHWHGETFDLPPGATRLAASAACPNQAFQIGRRVLGLQFHLEMTPETVDRMIRNCRDELTDGRYIQSEAAIRNTPSSVYSEANKIMLEMLDYITG